MTEVIELTSESFSEFIASHAVAVIHFDAAWNNTQRQIRLVMAEVAAQNRDSVGLGEVDVDEQIELALAMDLGTVPIVAYYLRGELVAKIIGPGQDIGARIDRLLTGERIGHGDGTKPKWLREPPIWPPSPKPWWRFW